MNEPIQHVCTKCGYIALTQYGHSLAERIRTLEAALAAQCEVNGLLQGELGVKGELLHQKEAEVARLQENEYAVLHKGLDLMAWVTVAEDTQDRVRELEAEVARLQSDTIQQWYENLKASGLAALEHEDGWVITSAGAWTSAQARVRELEARLETQKRAIRARAQESEG